ncbi:MAG: DegT/DnrJ/EryC1/StrS family aminotransferase, partial [Verrucomicrobiota bacterium]|nr:DegT/DnrJ/EryC1/StrS family aminotransferase [Verrucomicrobiota bacterium]
MNIPFLNLAAQYESLKNELLPVVEKVLAQGQYILGPNLTAFEEEIADYTETKFGVGLNSGSDALTLALRALEIGPGDEVITTPFSYIAPAEAIHQVGAKIVFADIDARTFNLDPIEVAGKISARTRAIIPVHLFGQAAPMQELQALAEPRQIQIIEDCAQAIGAKYRGRAVGSLGRLGCFSFYPTKNLGANGDAGMIVTNDQTLAKKLKMLRGHGIAQRYFHELHGVNSRLDELQAAILRVKLPHLQKWNSRRATIAERYLNGLKNLPAQLPQTVEGNTHVFHAFVILAEQRDELQKFLEARGVPTIIY